MTQTLGPWPGRRSATVASILPGTSGEGQAAEGGGGGGPLGGTRATQSGLQVDFKMAASPTGSVVESSKRTLLANAEANVAEVGP